ncbi:putative secreted metallopeptidase like protein [Verticillium longisporum]|nr:putative secreted metallopeptidase like protein [Verticillium longisporum]
MLNNKLTSFRMLRTIRSEAGVLSYTVAVRATWAADAGRRSVEVGRGLVTDLRHNKPTEKGVTCSFEVTNTGEGADLFRLEAQVEGQGWRVAVPNELLAVEEGKVGIAKVAVGAVADAAGEGVVTLKVTSERGDAEAAGECRMTRA